MTKYLYDGVDITNFMKEKMDCIVKLIASCENVPYHIAYGNFTQSNTFRVFADVENDLCFQSSQYIYTLYKDESRQLLTPDSTVIAL